MNTESISSLREALGQVIANERREWRRERELIEAQARETVSDLRAKVVEIERDVQQEVAERLAAVKDGEPGVNGADGKDGIDGQPGADGKDGKDADLDVVMALRMLEERVTEKIAALPPAENGKDADLTEVVALIDERIAALPVPEVKEDLAPDDVAANVALAIRMIAELPKSEASTAPVINVHSSVIVPESNHQVNVTMPEQAAPVVNVAPPNVVIEAKRSKDVTKVTGYDKQGRITSFEKTEVDA